MRSPRSASSRRTNGDVPLSHALGRPRLNRGPRNADNNGVNIALAALVIPPALAFGSFANVVAARVPLRRPVSKPRSSCTECGQEIRARDNIPLLSYVLLRGRCRSCHTGISPLYPAVEAVTAALVVACVLAFGATAYAALASFFVIVLVTLSAADLRYRLVPNRIVIPAAAVVLVAHTAIDPSPEWLLGALGASTFLLAAALAYPKGLGMGDVKVALLLGAMLGRNVALALMIGFLAALVPSLVLFARHGSSARKMAIPLVPFLAIGGVVALLAGDAILAWYLGLTG
jgi:leader peptidase (prepilin peptidase)/N-methyltransferase